jgi:phosphopantothenoylcysteine decarboxylase/phosphopantothenate--cysteine ligase
MEPAIGRLTGSDIGQGRFPETNEIITKFEEVTEAEKDYLGKRVLITAGGTREAIDPVRYIGNRSSGRQGAAVARAARDRGAQVKMIFANAQLSPDEIKDLSGIEIVSVETATEMFTALEEAFPKSDLLVMSAAVADARPSQYSEGKIKKGELRDIALVENPDLLKSIAKLRTKQVVVAFAAETNNDLAAAQAKMEAKGANILYLNNVSNGAIFGSLDTEGFIITSNGAHIPVPLTSKDTLAELLLDQALNQLG